MSDRYDIDAKRLGYFVGSVVAAAVVVTAVYVGLYGLKKWTGGVQQGANLMLAATRAPIQGGARTGTAGQYICPTHGAVGLPVFDAAGVAHCPICNQPMSFNGSRAGGQAGLVAFGGGGGG